MKANTSVSLWENEEKRGNWHNPHPNQRAGSFFGLSRAVSRRRLENIVKRTEQAFKKAKCHSIPESRVTILMRLVRTRKKLGNHVDIAKNLYRIYHQSTALATIFYHTFYI